MASPTSHRRLLLPLILAVMLVGEAAGLAVAARTASPAPTGSGSVVTPPARTHAGRWTPVSATSPIAAVAPTTQAHLRPSAPRAATVRPDVSDAAQSATTLVPSRSSPSVAGTYRGRNHLWIPALGINRSVAAFPCSRSQAPGNYVYRWGCAGTNNVYLMGHAYSVFKPLHDAYVSGRLRKGMKVIYADGNGRVRTYAVAWWKVTKPTTSASWAWAAQSRPSMTLQTCVGKNGALRLMVRLVATG
jgi:sortase (surface protein transpeptidase)